MSVAPSLVVWAELQEHCHPGAAKMSVAPAIRDRKFWRNRTFLITIDRNRLHWFWRPMASRLLVSLSLILILGPFLKAETTTAVSSERFVSSDLLEETLAAELSSMWTRDAGRLVAAIRGARQDDHPLPLTFLLAIAHAETNGRILLVSEAGAVGLAQTTPIAYLAEEMTGPLYVTSEYADGARAYFLKKPLWDVTMIATLLLESPGEETRKRARELLDAAFRYRREGVDDLELLVPFVGATFWTRIVAEDQANLELLSRLETMIQDCAGAEAFETLRDTAYERYQEMKEIQRVSWKYYQQDLSRKRDDLLRRTFRTDPKEVIRTRAWEAADVLARELDDRFSPASMAVFLACHTRTKLEEARALGVSETELIQVTAGLYNGGGHNIKRMRSGLIRSLPETVDYMEKVPATQRRLETRLAAANAENRDLSPPAPTDTK